MRLYKFALLAGAALGALIPNAAAQTAIKKIAVGADASYLGVNIQEITADRAKELKLREEAGVEVTRVETGSPAEQGGVKAGDIVTQYNGQRIEGIEQFSRLVRETPIGREARLSVIRAGAAQTITVKIGARQANLIEGFTRIAPYNTRDFSIQLPDVPRSRMSWRNSVLGIEAEALTGQLGDYFGVKEGVLVRSVNSGSAGEKAGIKAGDVIIRVAESRVSTPSDLTSRLRSIRSTSATVVLMRDKKEVTVTVALDDRASGRRTFRAEADYRF